MKQKDVALIILVAAISALISFFASKAVFAGAGNRQQRAEKVDAITTQFIRPSSKYFNSNSIDPTQLIQIGNTNNTNPFASSSQ